MMALSLCLQINWSEIELIASDPDEMHVFSVESFDDLGELLVDQLVASTCKVQGNPVGGKITPSIQIGLSDFLGGIYILTD